MLSVGPCINKNGMRYEKRDPKALRVAKQPFKLNF